MDQITDHISGFFSCQEETGKNILKGWVIAKLAHKMREVMKQGQKEGLTREEIDNLWDELRVRDVMES